MFGSGRWGNGPGGPTGGRKRSRSYWAREEEGDGLSPVVCGGIEATWKNHRMNHKHLNFRMAQIQNIFKNQTSPQFLQNPPPPISRMEHLLRAFYFVDAPVYELVLSLHVKRDFKNL